MAEPNRSSAQSWWAEYGEVVVVDTREEAVQVSGEYASEHLAIQCSDLEWWLANLNNYGCLFLGEETTVAYGDNLAKVLQVIPVV